MGVFTRDESELLSYDVDAFWYFACTMLAVCVVPWTALLLRSILRPRLGAEEDFNAAGPGAKELARVRHCGTSVMEAKRRTSNLRILSWRYRLGGSIKYQLVVVCVLWVMLFVVLWTLKDAPAALRSFDPHAILGLRPDAPAKEIKKAYRTRSLETHPDKNPDNPMAPVLFQQVAKAYAALTDETARQNYAKYGNPDGQGQMKVGIALHPIVLGSKESQRITICIFFFVLFLIPFSILCCCLRGSRLSFEGVSADTLKVLGACIDEEVQAEDGPGLLAASQEALRAARTDITPLVQEIYRNHTPVEPGLNVEIFNAPLRNGAAPTNGPNPIAMEAKGIVRRCFPEKRTCEVEILERNPAEVGPEASEVKGGELREVPMDRLEPTEPRSPCPFSDNIVRRNCILIWGHLWRLHEHMQPPVLAELFIVLRHSVTIGRAMIHFAAPHNLPAFFNVARNLIIFRRCLVQALDISGSPFLQLPHVDAKLLTPSFLKDAPSFQEVVSGGGEGFLNKLKLTAEQRLDVDAFCRHAPRVELDCKFEVLDEEDIAMGDMASLTVTLTRTNLDEGEASGPVHAPYFPVPKWEEWWIIVFDPRDRLLVTVDRINGTNRVESTKINFMVPRAGEFAWTVHAMCDSYAGLDVSCVASFNALKRNQVNHEVFVHPEDMKIKTFFEELMEGLNVEREEEESESEDELPLQATVGQKPASPKQVAAGSVEAAAPSEEKPAKANHSEDCDDSDCEACEDVQEPEGSFFEVTNASGGAAIYREPTLEKELRIGSIPMGVVVRATDSSDSRSSPPGWAELVGSGGAWIPIDDPDAPEASDQKDEDDVPCVCVKRLGGLLELPLRTVVQTRLPLLILKRWVKKSSVEITVADINQIVDIEETRIRTLIESFVRDKIGDERFEALRLETDKLKANKKERITKARGYFSSQNGILWYVGPTGQVKGYHPDGSKIRDRILEDEKTVRIGPFTLDETRNCSCIHWLRDNDPERAWVWARDNSVDTRVRLGSFG